MQQQTVGRQNKSITLQRGLYLLSYKSAKQANSPPTATIHIDATSVEPVLPPDIRTMTLKHPGTSIVLRVMQASKVGIELVASAPGGSMEAEFTCEPIAQMSASSSPAVDSAPASSIEPERYYPSAMPERIYGSAEQPSAMGAVSPPTPQINRYYSPPDRQGGLDAQSRPTASAAGGAISVMAHIAKLGDVTANANAWLAGPDAPARIEGFEIHWPSQPINVSLRYAAHVLGQRSSAPTFVGIGEFAGTRRQARPILAVVFELSGPGAAGFEMSCEALFLGSPPRRYTGALINVRGPSGREPLVGLKFSIADLRTGVVDRWSSPGTVDRWQGAASAPTYQPHAMPVSPAASLSAAGHAPGHTPPGPIAIQPETPPVNPRTAQPPPNRRPPAGGGGRVRVFRG